MPRTSPAGSDGVQCEDKATSSQHVSAAPIASRRRRTRADAPLMVPASSRRQQPLLLLPVAPPCRPMPCGTRYGRGR
ncbi:hypothetical protein DAI22_07g253100 [Oryza sativa Japonica Group]|nr:hypothetical protein DAI22_07g253100 [Oryza sativa Japonica Group]